MNRVFTAAVQDIHHEQIVGQQHYLLLGCVAVSIFHRLLGEHAAFAAVAEPTRRRGTQQFLNLRRDAGAFRWDNDFDFFLNHVHFDLASKRERVGDFAEVLTLVADARVLTLKLHARVRAFDLGLLLAHPHLVVGMQPTEPHRRTLAVRTLLGNTQPATPQGLHAVLFGVLYEVLELGAAGAVLGLQENRAELGLAVLKQLGPCHRGRYCWRCIWALPRQAQRGRCRYWSQRGQLGRNGLADGLEVKAVALGQQLDLLGLPVLPRAVLFVLLEVERIGDAQHSCSVCCHSHVDVELLLLAQTLEVLGCGLPHSHIDVFSERPVAVQSTAREHNPRSAQRIQASFGKERTECQRSLLLGSVAVHVDEQ